MQSTFKKFSKFLIWLVILNLAIAGGLLSSLKQAKAQTLPTVQFEQYYDMGFETTSNVKIKVNLSEISSQDVSVDYAVVGGSAIINTDYTLDSDSLEIPADNLSGEINLNIINNLTCEADKTIDIALDNPENAILGSQSKYTYKILETDCNPKTTLVIDPATPDGQNNWYVTTPSITLTTVEQLQTFYQWDSKNIDGWIVYDESVPIIVTEGRHILYYLSQKYDQLEEIQSAEFKVDLTVPEMPSVSSSVNDNGVVSLSWLAVTDANAYQIWRSDAPLVIANLGKDQLSFVDNSVSRGQDYQYNIVALDEAGNRSDIAKISVKVSAVVITLAVANIEEPKPVVIAENIGNGISTNQQEVAPEIAAANDTQVATPEAQTSESHRNWNQLLLAISILIIAVGAAIGGYYGYEWWMSHRDDDGDKPSVPKSRW